MNIPKQTSDIFELLSKGQFICSNSPNEATAKLYDVIDENFEALHDYFAAINFSLEKGDEFFYFTRGEARVDLERKLEAAFRWIDIVDFFKTVDHSFGPGYRFTPSDILVRLNVDAELKAKLEGLKRYTQQERFDDSVRKLLDLLSRDNYIELENEISMTYKVLTSFKYLEQFILAIHIQEDAIHEISE
ncbi:hypothetical protein LX69_01288 [Breznakibacter xylanolyticus]|uniref:Uncharacterized protein n=1 Tax=Breznakibacter xylanolyticus TaxID=990 RepID=A0A2W7NBR0_9BACT|nr:hypothetical protein [Breznakibacter xylanolyticus]PZX17875.1 hypothetical protein LX69_01288 [Breznakibacter xylanolyticus]